MSNNFSQVAVLGAGVIGASWTALFSAAGLAVRVYDPMPNAEENVGKYLNHAMPVLRELGMAHDEQLGKISFHTSAVEAVQGCQFIQECIPEKLNLKHQLFAEIEPHLQADAIVASSASGLMVSEMQSGWKDPSRFILGHPFNPPHLIPLVELLANDKTASGVLEQAEDFYKFVGKVTIRVQREVPAHVANRLQAVLWKEAIHLVESGVASVEDVDKAVWAGPGLRWAAMGPHMLFNLGAGEGGIADFCNRYGDSFHCWWDDLGQAKLNPSTVTKLVEGLAPEMSQQTTAELSQQRDALIVGMLKATKSLRGSD